MSSQQDHAGHSAGYTAEAPLRAIAVALSLLPQAIRLGIPFPKALELAGLSDRRQVALPWSVNGAMTVVGSVASMGLSLTLGFSAVLWLGACSYAPATAILLLLRRWARS